MRTIASSTGAVLFGCCCWGFLAAAGANRIEPGTSKEDAQTVHGETLASDAREEAPLSAATGSVAEGTRTAATRTRARRWSPKQCAVIRRAT